jgi:poly[(R)-3-hydroxyalkanoate] polymerase subunit PhaC
MRAQTTSQTLEDATGIAGALDFLLTDAALGPLRRLLSGKAGVRAAVSLVRHPGSMGRRLVDLGLELGRVTVGRSHLAPAKRDRRFTDPAWRDNPLLVRIVQTYLAVARTAESLLSDAELSWEDRERMTFVLDNVLQALAPSNNPLINPVAWKALIDTGGGNVVRGVRNFVNDMSAPPRVPSMVDAHAFELGESLATTPGAVVLRTPVFELIQYRPQTSVVHTTPLLLVPPTINKYYITDLAPGRSLVEYLVQQGQQVFLMSWRNPDVRHREWGFDAYGQAILDALEAVRDIAGTESAHLLSICSGGILGSLTAAHLAHTQRLGEIASLTLAVSVLDQSRAGTARAILGQNTARAAIAASSARGYLDGRALAEIFAWLRPNDLIWGYWINNYLQGRAPAPFDILYWNADTTRMTAALHADFVQATQDNAVTRPGAITMLGSPVDLSTVHVDSYIIAGIADHLCPWKSCYASTQLFGGTTRFVLSTSGHIAAIVNPPGNIKARFQVAKEHPADPEEWAAAAETVEGSWWPDYSAWLAERGGPEIDAPEALGSERFPAAEPAPGVYVLDH